MSLDENKAGAAAVDPSDFNTVVDAVVVLQAGSESGGSQPEVETIYADTAAVAPGGNTWLTWTHSDGAALVDYTDPAHPTLIESGKYAVTAVIQGGDVSTLGGSLFYAVGISPPIGTTPPTPLGYALVPAGAQPIAWATLFAESPDPAGVLAALVNPAIAETISYHLDVQIVKFA